MATRRRQGSAWSFGRKLTLWLSDHGESLNAFARRHGIVPQTLRGWVNRGRRLPATAASKIAAATGLPTEYWLDDALPYPPALEYLNLADDALALLKTLPIEQLSEVVEMLRDPEDLRRSLALRRAARSPGTRGAS